MAKTIVGLLMERDGLDESEAREVAEDIYAEVTAGKPVGSALMDHGIDPRELGLEPVNFGL